MNRMIPTLMLCAVLSGCGGGSGTTIAVDTSPVGVGLAAIAAAMLLSAFVSGGAK
jgi:hypothetical protein